MNKLKWLVVILLGSGFIVSGLVIGYYRSGNSVVIEQDNVSKEALVKPVMPLQMPIKKPKSVSLTKAAVNESDPVEESAALDAYAIESMADARLNGDDRAPPIVHGPKGDYATPEEIESPELYLEYESRQERKIYKSYVEAADIKIEMLEEQISIAKERGMAEEEIEVGIEKVRKIKEMKAQLLRDNPDLIVEN